jgi:glutamate dehydrogenase/leucine dehydrogenase
MRKGLDKREVESLAKTMEVKFTVSGPAIGGAKSGINFDPQDPRKRGVLERWYRAVFPLLKNYYGTGGDLNVDEIHEVIAITEEYGLWHPQEGVVNGHFKATEPQKIQKLGQLRTGVIKVVEDAAFSPDLARKYTVADLITGYGVAEAVAHYYRLWLGTGLRGQRAIVQGWGNVGAAAAFYLAGQGVRVVGIIDRAGGLLSEEGFSLEEIRALLLARQGNALTAPDLLPFAEINEKIWSVGADIFIPAAASRLVTREQVDQLLRGGLKVISCGANVPFADPEIFFGPTGEFADEHTGVVPDFIANCGMARVFAYLMETGAEITDHAIFSDTSRIIGAALERTHRQHEAPTGIAQHAFELALRELV